MYRKIHLIKYTNPTLFTTKTYSTFETAIVTSIFMGMIEGFGIVFNKAASQMYKPQAPQIESDPNTVSIPSQGTIEGNTGGLAAFQ